MDVEIWKDVKGYEGMYQVSNLGRVRSLDRVYTYQSNSGKSYTRFFKGQMLTQGHVSKYLQVALCDRKHTRTPFVHRLVAEAFIPNPDNLPQVNHKDENPENNNVDNLEWCSASYNVNYGRRNEIVRSKLKGIQHSPEHIEKVRASLLGKTPWNKGRHTRPIVCLDANIQFDCAEDAANWLGGVTPEAVEYVLKRKACCKGHVFVHADNVPQDIPGYVQQCLENYRKGSKAGRPCRCIEDDKCFQYISEAATFYGLTHNVVWGKIHSGKAAKLSDGRTVHFESIPYDTF